MAVPEAQKVDLELADWGNRFLAWLIDTILVGVGIQILLALLAFPFVFSMFMTGSFPSPGFPFSPAAFLFPFGLNSVIFLLYWTYFESALGQSIGKQLMNLKVVDATGKNPTVTNALIESVGKAFVLPLDVLIGLIAFGDTKQRLFSKIADTKVVRVPAAERKGGIRLTAG